MAADFLFDGSQLMISTDSANDVVQVDRDDFGPNWGNLVLHGLAIDNEPGATPIRCFSFT